MIDKEKSKNRSKIYFSEYYSNSKNKKKINKKNKKYYKDNKEKAKEYNKKYSKEHYKKRVRIKTPHNKEKERIYKLTLRLNALNYYSNNELKCNCCLENELRFLAIDHIYNNGNEHRRNMKSNIYVWLKQNNYPEGFQVLCHNCNMGKAFNHGVCPHVDSIKIRKVL